MAETAGAAGRIGHLARARLHVGDKFLERLGLNWGLATRQNGLLATLLIGAKSLTGS